MSEHDPIEPLRDALAFSPENEKLRIHLATTCSRHGRHEEAIEALKDGLRRAPMSDLLGIALARVYLAAGRPPEALVVADSVRDRTPDAPGLQLLRAQILLALGESQDAAQAYHRAVDQDPDSADESLAEKLGIYREEEEGGRRVPAHGAVVEDTVAGLKLEKTGVTFADVGGMDSVKDQVRMKIIHPLQHPEIYRAYGKQAGGGLLLYGPPGCGKTHMARATAGEVNANFLNIGIEDVLDMWLGESERKLHEVFEYARKNTPCVLFFDEVDALGGKRSRFTNNAGRNLVNQFLSELDGAKHRNEGLLILAATNTPWDVDPAFRRPGRFDQVVFVPPPDTPAREDILKILLRDKPTESIDTRKLAKKTDGFSGADLQGLVNLAIEERLREAMRDGIPKPLTNADLVKAAKQARPSTSEWFAAAKNYALYANQGGTYDEIRKYLGL